jgi:hypothetical protein
MAIAAWLNESRNNRISKGRALARWLRPFIYLSAVENKICPKKRQPLTLHRPMLHQMANGIFLQPVTTIVTPLPCCNPWPAASIDVVLSSHRQ